MPHPCLSLYYARASKNPSRVTAMTLLRACMITLPKTHRELAALLLSACTEHGRTVEDRGLSGKTEQQRLSVRQTGYSPPYVLADWDLNMDLLLSIADEHP